MQDIEIFLQFLVFKILEKRCVKTLHLAHTYFLHLCFIKPRPNEAKSCALNSAIGRQHREGCKKTGQETQQTK